MWVRGCVVCEWMCRGLAALAALVSSLCTDTRTAAAAPLKPKVPHSAVSARMCVIPPLALTPIYVDAAPAKAEDSDDEDDGDDGEEDEDDEDTVRGMMDGSGQTCLALSGSLTGSMQLTRMRLPAGISSRSQDITTTSTSATLKLTTLTTLSDGTEIRSKLAYLAQPTTEAEPNGLLVTEATVGIGGWEAGYASSQFNFWDGGEFLFGARIPARSTHQITRKVQVTGNWFTTLSLENGNVDPAVSRPAVLQPLPGMRWPDVVARLGYASDVLELHMAGAITERASANGAPSRVGKAGIIGATGYFDLAGKNQSVTIQAAGASDAPLYLGTQVDVRAVRRLVDVGDATRGFSGLVSTSRDWSETLTTSLYASMIRLDFPNLGTKGGRAEMWRGAANVVFTPVKGTRFGLEAGLSRAKVNLPNRVIPNDLSSRQMTAVLWYDRSF